MKSKALYCVSGITSVPAGADAGKPLLEFNDYVALRNDQGTYSGFGGNW